MQGTEGQRGREARRRDGKSFGGNKGHLCGHGERRGSRCCPGRVSAFPRHSVPELRELVLALGRARCLLARAWHVRGGAARSALGVMAYSEPWVRCGNRRHRSGINSLALNRRGELLFSAGRDATARCWSTGNPHAKCERTFDAHTDWVNDCVLLSDEATLVTCSSDTTIKLWNVPHEKCLATLTEHTDYVKALAYARDRSRSPPPLPLFPACTPTFYLRSARK